MKIHSLRRLGAATLAGLYFLVQSVFPRAAEANFWSERREAAAQKPAGENVLMASLPAVAAAPAAFLSLPENAGITADPALQEKLKGLPPSLSRIPSAFGEVRGVHLAPQAGAPLVVLIQDAHQVLSAQKNIDRILDHLSKAQANGLLIGIEGSAGSFEIPTYRRLPDQAAQKEIADALFEKNLITGAERFGLTAEKEPTLWGMEDTSLYLRNVNAYRAALGAAQEAEKSVQELQARLAADKEKAFSPALKALDAAVEGYERGRTPLAEYVEVLSGTAGTAGFPEVAKFSRALAMEKSLDFKAVEKERTQLIEKLSAASDKASLEALAQSALAYRAGRIGHGAFYGALGAAVKKAGVSLGGYPAFSAYVEYALASEKVRPAALFDQLEGLKDAAAAKTAKTPEERRLFRAQGDLRLAGALLKHELTADQWRLYQARRASLARADKSFVGRLKPFEQFYEAATSRNRVLATNLLTAMRGRKDGSAVLIAGGFHAAGLERELAARGASVVTLTPRIDTLPERASAYLDVFGPNRTSLEKMLLGERLTANPPSAFASPNPLLDDADKGGLGHRLAPQTAARAANAAASPEAAEVLGGKIISNENGVTSAVLSSPAGEAPLAVVAAPKDSPAGAREAAKLNGALELQTPSRVFTIGRMKVAAVALGAAALAGKAAFFLLNRAREAGVEPVPQDASWAPAMLGMIGAMVALTMLLNGRKDSDRWDSTRRGQVLGMALTAVVSSGQVSCTGTRAQEAAWPEDAVITRDVLEKGMDPARPAAQWVQAAMGVTSAKIRKDLAPEDLRRLTYRRSSLIRESLQSSRAESRAAGISILRQTAAEKFYSLDDEVAVYAAAQGLGASPASVRTDLSAAAILEYLLAMRGQLQAAPMGWDAVRPFLRKGHSSRTKLLAVEFLMSVPQRSALGVVKEVLLERSSSPELRSAVLVGLAEKVMKGENPDLPDAWLVAKSMDWTDDTGRRAALVILQPLLLLDRIPQSDLPLVFDKLQRHWGRDQKGLQSAAQYAALLAELSKDETTRLEAVRWLVRTVPKLAWVDLTMKRSLDALTRDSSAEIKAIVYHLLGAYPGLRLKAEDQAPQEPKSKAPVDPGKVLGGSGFLFGLATVAALFLTWNGAVPGWAVTVAFAWDAASLMYVLILRMSGGVKPGTLAPAGVPVSEFALQRAGGGKPAAPARADASDFDADESAGSLLQFQRGERASFFKDNLAYLAAQAVPAAGELTAAEQRAAMMSLVNGNVRLADAADVARDARFVSALRQGPLDALLALLTTTEDQDGLDALAAILAETSSRGTAEEKYESTRKAVGEAAASLSGRRAVLGELQNAGVAYVDYRGARDVKALTSLAELTRGSADLKPVVFLVVDVPLPSIIAGIEAEDARLAAELRAALADGRIRPPLVVGGRAAVNPIDAIATINGNSNRRAARDVALRITTILTDSLDRLSADELRDLFANAGLTLEQKVDLLVESFGNVMEMDWTDVENARAVLIAA